MFVTNSLSGGGAERAINLVVNEMIARNVEVSLVPINAGQEDWVKPTCPVFQVQRTWKSGLIETAFSWIRFNSIIIIWKPDILVLNCDIPELFGLFSFSRAKIIVVEHANPAWSTRPTFGKIIRNLLRLRKPKWVAVSEHLKIWPWNEIPDRILENSIVFNDDVKNKKSVVDQDSQVTRLLYVGRLASAQKRPQIVIEVAASTGLPVLFIGDGEMRVSLEEMARNCGVSAEFAGSKINPWDNFQCGDLLIVPSAWEGDGLVVVEALQNNIPLLLSDIRDFKRFNLPAFTYCKGAEDYVNKIKNSESTREFVIPATVSSAVLKTRSISVVGDNWIDFLKNP
jgi:hypothetical protein